MIIIKWLTKPIQIIILFSLQNLKLCYKFDNQYQKLKFIVLVNCIPTLWQKFRVYY